MRAATPRTHTTDRAGHSSTPMGMALSVVASCCIKQAPLKTSRFERGCSARLVAAIEHSDGRALGRPPCDFARAGPNSVESASPTILGLGVVEC